MYKLHGIFMDLDNEAIELLKAQLRAEEDNRKLKQSELNVLRRREQLSLDERDATVKLRSEVERLVLELGKLSEEIAASVSSEILLSKKIEKLADELADVEQGLYSVLSRDLAEMRKSRDRVGRRLETKEELKIHYRNLEKLREQAAQYGPLDIPLNVQNSIKLEEQKIRELET